MTGPAGRAVLALGFLRVLAASAAAGEEAELEGRVTDGAGQPVAGADLVLSDGLGRAWRRTTISDADGRFSLLAPPGLVRLVGYLDDGAEVVARVLELPPGRSFVTVDAGGVAEPVPAPALAEGALLPPIAPAGAPLVRGRDLGGLLEALPTASPGTPLAVGARLAGSGPGELEVSFEGLDLRDPVSGVAPLELPLALAGGVQATHSWGPGVDGGRGGGSLRLRAPATDGPRLAASGMIGARAPGRAAFGRWLGEGGAGPAAIEVRAAGRHRRGGIWAAAAPRVEDLGLSLEGSREDAARRRTLLPAAAGGTLAASGWQLAGLALGLLGTDEHERAGPIVPAGARDRLTRRLAGGRIEATRGFHGPDQVTVAGDGLWTHQGLRTRGGDSVDTDGRRLSLSAGVVLGGDLLGAHLSRVAIGGAWAHAGRSGPQPSRAPDGAAGQSSARGFYPYGAVDDRYRPTRFLEIELGITAASLEASGQSDAPAAAGGVSLSTEPLVAPRLAVRLRHAPTGTGVFLGAGRFATLPPLEGLLEASESPAATLTSPHEDAALGGVEWRRSGLALALTGVERRTRAVIEDRLSLLTTRLVPFNPADVRRRYRAATFQAAVTWRRLEATAAYTVAALTGNFPGYADAGAGAVRPGATASFDTADVEANRDGPLPTDRRHAARLALATRRAWRTLTWAAGISGRLDQGVPLDALARSATSGPGETFLAPRGSQGRTPWLATADAAVSAQGSLHGARVGVALEGFNLSNGRAVIARDEIYTDRVPGEGSTLGAGVVKGPSGEPLPVSPGYRAPTAYAAPLLVRLVLTVEM